MRGRYGTSYITFKQMTEEGAAKGTQEMPESTLVGEVGQKVM